MRLVARSVSRASLLDVNRRCPERCASCGYPRAKDRPVFAEPDGRHAVSSARRWVAVVFLIGTASGITYLGGRMLWLVLIDEGLRVAALLVAAFGLGAWPAAWFLEPSPATPQADADLTRSSTALRPLGATGSARLPCGGPRPRHAEHADARAWRSRAASCANCVGDHHWWRNCGGSPDSACSACPPAHTPSACPQTPRIPTPLLAPRLPLAF